MANLFEPVVSNLLELGFYDLLIFIIVAAIFYGLLKKSKVLGESVAINGVVSLSIAFLVFGFRWITGIALTTNLSAFFTQAAVVLLFLLFGFIGASMFYPDMTKWLTEVFSHRTMLAVLITLGLALLITSGLITVLWSGGGEPAEPGEVQTPTDVIVVGAGLLIFMVLIIIASSVVRGAQ